VRAPNTRTGTGTGTGTEHRHRHRQAFDFTILCWPGSVLLQQDALLDVNVALSLR
jgi:hypothetical protein